MDSRPPNFKRQNLPYEVQYCPKCGYCAPNIAKKRKDQNVPSALLTVNRELSLSERFECAANILLAQGVRDYATYHLFLKGAWSADDTGDADRALFLRTRYLNYPCLKHEAVKIRLILADTARRIGDFEKAHFFLKECGNLPDGDSTFGKLFMFEERLCNERDVQCHSCDEIFEKNSFSM